ncbi:Lrp/AsnC family transcriptional regulator [Candidatus Woesearchaeota archaeon]|nr:Lrp/AsnC family transcriptional regulator [Candidatus Woesearchaeota archaeon]
MKLDVKDRKILQELDLDPKITTSKLAKNIRLSHQVTNYRINKLIENKIISQFGTIINLSKIGYKQYRILFQLNKISEQEKQEIINYLKQHPKVYWAAIVGGKWDLLAVVFVNNYEEFEKLLDELFNKFQNKLKDYDSVYALYHELYKHKYLHENKILEPIKLDFKNPEKIIELDKIDLQILNETKSNCRLSSLEISKKCKVNYKTIQNRIKNLENKELISGYRIFIKSNELNYKAYLILISFQNYGREIEKKLFSYAKNNKFVTQSIKLFGSWSLLLHIRIKDERELQNLIIELRNNYPIIGNYEIIPIFEDISINNFPMSEELINSNI